MPLRFVTGLTHQTTAGWVTGNVGNKFADAISGTAPTISVVDGRTWLDVNSAGASAMQLRWDTNTIAASQTRFLLAFRLRLPTTVPTVDILYQANLAAGLAPILRIDASDVLFAAFEGGNEQAGPTLSPDTDYWVEMHVDVSANPHVIDWYVDGIARTQVTQAQAATTLSLVGLGSSNNETFRALYTDALCWTDTADITPFPIGKHKVVGLFIDSAGTFTLTGTAANFNTFTANGTLAAWNATTARNNTDEIPVTIGASADGWVQITLATGDFVDMPLTTYTLAGGETVTGLRAWFVGWATSTTAGTFGVRAFNGTTEETLQAGTVDPNFDNSTTVPAWVCKMLTLANYDTQAELNALSLRGGFSSDATPDEGLHGCGVEVAIKESTLTGPPLPILVMPPPRPS